MRAYRKATIMIGWIIIESILAVLMWVILKGAQGRTNLKSRCHNRARYWWLAILIS